MGFFFYDRTGICWNNVEPDKYLRLFDSNYYIQNGGIRNRTAAYYYTIFGVTRFKNLISEETKKYYVKYLKQLKKADTVIASVSITSNAK